MALWLSKLIVLSTSIVMMGGTIAPPVHAQSGTNETPLTAELRAEQVTSMEHDLLRQGYPNPQARLIAQVVIDGLVESIEAEKAGASKEELAKLDKKMVVQIAMVLHDNPPPALKVEFTRIDAELDKAFEECANGINAQLTVAFKEFHSHMAGFGKSLPDVAEDCLSLRAYANLAGASYDNRVQTVFERHLPTQKQLDAQGNALAKPFFEQVDRLLAHAAMEAGSPETITTGPAPFAFKASDPTPRTGFLLTIVRKSVASDAGTFVAGQAISDAMMKDMKRRGQGTGSNFLDGIVCFGAGLVIDSALKAVTKKTIYDPKADAIQTCSAYWSSYSAKTAGSFNDYLLKIVQPRFNRVQQSCLLQLKIEAINAYMGSMKGGR